MENNQLTNEIIGAFYAVYNTLGYGFLEKVYEKAMVIELRKRNIECVAQYLIEVNYHGEKIGHYYADILVKNLIVLELKASEFINKNDEFQLINYLKGSDKEIGFLMNFGKTPEFRRKIYSNSRKIINE